MNRLLLDTTLATLLTPIGVVDGRKSTLLLELGHGAQPE